MFSICLNGIAIVDGLAQQPGLTALASSQSTTPLLSSDCRLERAAKLAPERNEGPSGPPPLWHRVHFGKSFPLHPLRITLFTDAVRGCIARGVINAAANTGRKRAMVAVRWS